MPTSGSAIEVLGGFPVLEVGMVGLDDEGYFSPTQVRPPMGEGFHYSQKFSFVDIVISLSGREGCRIIG